MIATDTRHLTGPALNWAIATIKCDTAAGERLHIRDDLTVWIMKPTDCAVVHRQGTEARYAHDWAQAGPLIQEALISLTPEHNWIARTYMDATRFTGNDPLTAAMRCYAYTQHGIETFIPRRFYDATT